MKKEWRKLIHFLHNHSLPQFHDKLEGIYRKRMIYPSGTYAKIIFTTNFFKTCSFLTILVLYLFVFFSFKTITLPPNAEKAIVDPLYLCFYSCYFFCQNYHSFTFSWKEQLSNLCLIASFLFSFFSILSLCLPFCLSNT